MSYLVAAYTAIWVILFVYIFSLVSRQSELKKEVDSLLREVQGRK